MMRTKILVEKEEYKKATMELIQCKEDLFGINTLMAEVLKFRSKEVTA